MSQVRIPPVLRPSAGGQKLLDDLSAKIDTPTLADLYKQVSVDKKDVKDVVSTFLKAQGLVK